MALGVGWLALVLGRGAISPLLPAIIDGLGISPARAGFAFTLMTGLYALLQFPGGRLSDQLSRTAIIGVGLGVMAGGFWTVTIASGYPGFLLGVALVGIGGGLFFSPSRAFIADLFVERRGQAFGLQTAAGMVGGVLAATSAAAVLTVASWRAAFLPSIGLSLGVLLVLVRWSDEPRTWAPVQWNLASTTTRLFGSRRISLLVVGFALFGFAAQGFIGFLPTLLQLEKGFSPVLASGGYALIYVIGIVVGPLAGRVSDWLPRRQVIIGAPAIGGLGLLVLLAAPSTALTAVGIGLMSVGLWGYFPSVHAYLGDLLADDSLGGDFGLIKTVYTELGSLGPTYVGLMAERTSFAVAFVGLIGCLLACAVVLFIATRLEDRT